LSKDKDSPLYDQDVTAAGFFPYVIEAMRLPTQGGGFISAIAYVAAAKPYDDKRSTWIVQPGVRRLEWN